MRQLLLGLCAALVFGVVQTASAQTVRVDNLTVHSRALEGNLEGNSADRSVTVYLPADYDANPGKRYPVLYALHGYSINNEIWSKEIKTPQTIEAAYGAGVKGMIVVLPSSQTAHNGSMYSSSATTGDWEGFIANDLVAYIDSHYRTLAQRESRGLAGHSMGGYGTFRIAMKRPDVFSAFYSMSPCCMSYRGAPSPEQGKQIEALTSQAEAQSQGFMVRATLAVASAWSPNPKNPPFYVDLPTKDGVAQPDVLARWAANAPLSMVHQYIPSLRRYKAIAFDVGDRDGLKVDTEALHTILNTYNVANSFELYDGDHVSGVADRFQNHVLPFFAKHLSFEPVAQ